MITVKYSDGGNVIMIAIAMLATMQIAQPARKTILLLKDDTAGFNFRAFLLRGELTIYDIEL